MHTMQRTHQIAAGCIVAIAAYIIITAYQMEYYTNLGPGPGFFPLWLGAILGGLGVIWLVQVSLPAGRSLKGKFFPNRGGLLRILATVGALLMVVLCMNPLGFQLTMFLFLFFMLKALGEQKLWLTVVIALVGSVGTFYLFGIYLDVQLPRAGLGWLANLGL